MVRTLVRCAALLILCFAFAWSSWAQPDRDPANVAVAKITKGTIAPEKTFVGSVYYPEVSDVSAEVSGRVDTVTFEEGQSVTKGAVLVRMDSSLLKKTLQSQTASHEQVLSDLKRASKDLERTQNLYERKIVAEKDLDDQIYTVQGLEKKAASLKAEAERLEIELEKTIIRAPFNGIILKKSTAVGEWLSPGSTVATIAMNGAFDIVVSVPEEIISHLERGMEVPVTAGGTKTAGSVSAIIPKGDIATRTFPVKIRVTADPPLMEGMEAQVTLPAGRRIEALFVPRDAILNVYNDTFIVTVNSAKVSLRKVRIVGYQGMKVGIGGDNVDESLKVVVKGHERLKDGDPVKIIEESD